MGLASLGKKAYADAVAAFSRAIELKPDYWDAWRNRARAYQSLGQADKALADYSHVIEQNPKDGSAWMNRGLAYLYFHQYHKALADLNKTVDLNPKDAAAWGNRGKVYTFLHEQDKALADLNKAIGLDGKNGAIWGVRAEAYTELHQYDRALADHFKAIDLDPKHPALWNNLAWLLATCPNPKFRDASKAVSLAKKAVELAPKEGILWNTLGAASYRARNWKAAVAALEKSMELRQAGDSVVGLDGFFQVKGRTGQDQDADHRPGGDSYDWFFLAMAHWQLGEKDKARKWFDQAVQWMNKNAPQNEELRRLRAEAAALLGIEAQPAVQEKKMPPLKDSKEKLPTSHQQAADTPKKPSDPQVQELINQLGSDKFDEREAATRRPDTLGDRHGTVLFHGAGRQSSQRGLCTGRPLRPARQLRQDRAPMAVAEA
jgi:tetratricopeptide (TPR) repeat protein